MNASAAKVPKGYKQTEVGVVPEDWEVLRLGDFIALQRGHDLTERDRRAGNVPVYGSAGLNGYHDTVRAKGPGVILGRSGASFGQAHYCETDYWPHNTAMYVTDYHDNYPKFVYYFLRSIDFSRHNSGGAQQSLNRNFIAPILVSIPDNTEQQAIAEALGDADALIESLQQQIAKKRLLKQAAMQELLTAKRRLPGFTGGWEVRRLGDLGHFLKGSGIRKDEAQSGSLPCVRYGEIYTKHNNVVRHFCSSIAQEVAKSSIRITAGDILFAGSGETREEIGKCVAIVSDGEAYAGGDIVILRTSCGDAAFLGYYLNSRDIVIQKANFGQGDAVVHISASALARIRCRLPGISEQTAIAEVLSDMDDDIEATETKLAKARLVKQGMMQELLTGRVRLV